jgi:hypothetical protein
MPSTMLTDSTGLTARAAASHAGVLHGPYGLVLGVLSAVILYGGWAGLWFVAHRYPRATGRRRRFGQWLQGMSAITALGTVIAWLDVRTDRCGHVRGAAGARATRWINNLIAYLSRPNGDRGGHSGVVPAHAQVVGNRVTESALRECHDIRARASISAGCFPGRTASFTLI